MGSSGSLLLGLPRLLGKAGTTITDLSTLEERKDLPLMAAFCKYNGDVELASDGVLSFGMMEGRSYQRCEAFVRYG